MLHALRRRRDVRGLDARRRRRDAHGLGAPRRRRDARRALGDIGVVRLGARLAATRPVVFGVSTVLFVGWWGAPAAVGLLLRALFDAIAGQGAPPLGLGLAGLAAAYLAVEAARSGALFGAVELWIRWFVAAGTRVRANLLSAQLASGERRADVQVRDPGGAITRFRDDVDDLAFYVDTWIDLAGVAVFATVATAIMLRIDAVVAVVVLVPLALVIAVNRVLTGRIKAYRRADREATQHVTGFVGDVLAGVATIKTAGAEDAAVARLRERNAARQHTALRDRLLTDLLHGVNGSTVELSIGLVLLLAAGSMRAGTFTVGDLALFATYVTWFAALPRWVGLLLARHRHAQVSAARLAPLLPGARSAEAVAPRPPVRAGWTPPAPAPHRAAGAPAAIEVRGLAVRHADGAPALDGVDLDLPAGSLTVVCGPVGSGKSTLLRALLGLVPVAAGEVRWNGERVTDLGAHMVPPNAAYVGQVPRLFGESLRANLAVGRGVPDRVLARAVRLAVLDRDVAGMPAGLDTLVGSRGVRLSGGQVQRAAAARALAAEPALLVLDDLSSALDVDTERALWEGLLADRRSTVLAVAHRRVALEHADRVVVLERGRVAAAGTLADLRAAGRDPLAPSP